MIHPNNQQLTNQNFEYSREIISLNNLVQEYPNDLTVALNRIKQLEKALKTKGMH